MRMAMLGGRVAPGDVTIGRDVGPGGRWVRAMAGALSLSYGIAGFFAGSATAAAEVGQILAAVALLAVYYLVLHVLLGERLFARANPWFGTTLVLGSLGVFTAPFMPGAMTRGAGLYVGATLILAAVIRYGGCEVVAPPTLLFRRRYVLYCPWNAVDAAERPLHRLRADVAVRLAAVGTAIVGVYFVLGRDILARFGLSDPIASWWALLLLVPAGLLGHRTLQASRRREEEDRGEVHVLGLGAVVLLALAVYFAVQIPQDIAWAAVMLGGLAYATGRAVLAAVRRRRAVAR